MVFMWRQWKTSVGIAMTILVWGFSKPLKEAWRLLPWCPMVKHDPARVPRLAPPFIFLLSLSLRIFSGIQRSV